MNVYQRTTRKLPGHVPCPSLDRLWHAQHGCCAICGRRLSPHSGLPQRPSGRTIEHVFPRSYGYGRAANAVLTCWTCNSTRRDAWPTAALLRKARAVYTQLLAPNTVTALRGRHPLFSPEARVRAASQQPIRQPAPSMPPPAVEPADRSPQDVFSTWFRGWFRRVSTRTC